MIIAGIELDQRDWEIALMAIAANRASLAARLLRKESRALAGLRGGYGAGEQLQVDKRRQALRELRGALHAVESADKPHRWDVAAE